MSRLNHLRINNFHLRLAGVVHGLCERLCVRVLNSLDAQGKVVVVRGSQSLGYEKCKT